MKAWEAPDSPWTESFWKNNHLPQGTTEFVCVDGKAYLLKDAPAGSIDDRSNLP